MQEAGNYNPSISWGEKERGQEQPEELSSSTPFFTYIRQQGATALQITFILKNQRHHTLPIQEIEEIYFHPVDGIVLFFRFGLVKIEGRNLEELHTYLQRRQVKEIREFGEDSTLFFDKEALFISKITYASDHLTQLGLVG